MLKSFDLELRKLKNRLNLSRQNFGESLSNSDNSLMASTNLESFIRISTEIVDSFLIAIQWHRFIGDINDHFFFLVDQPDQITRPVDVAL